VQAYIAAVRFVDEQIGRLLDALDTSGHKDNTIIILLSDHGFHLGEKQRWAKQSLWERSTRVPFIVSVPGGLKGSKCSKPVELLSIYPTLIELCDIEKRSDLEGVSITQLLKSPDSDWQHPAITTYRQNNHAIRSEHYRYIRYSDGAEELYDHRKDPNEWNNLAANPESAEVKKKHARWLPKVNVPEAKGTQRPRKKLNPRS
jgi:arylsulfatase A-like enzyme